MKKQRNKKYQGPKYVARNVLTTVFGGMSGAHVEHLRLIQIRSHKALADMARAPARGRVGTCWSAQSTWPTSCASRASATSSAR